MIKITNGKMITKGIIENKNLYINNGKVLTLQTKNMTVIKLLTLRAIM